MTNIQLHQRQTSIAEKNALNLIILAAWRSGLVYVLAQPEGQGEGAPDTLLLRPFLFPHPPSSL